MRPRGARVAKTKKLTYYLLPTTYYLPPTSYWKLQPMRPRGAHETKQLTYYVLPTTYYLPPISDSLPTYLLPTYH